MRLPLIGLVLLAGCAGTAAEPQGAMREGRQCFRADQVNGFSSRGEREVDVHVGARDRYRLELLGTCHDIDWSQSIAIQSRGSSWICSGLDAELIVPSSIGPNRCPVRAIRKLSDDEARAADRAK